MHREGAGGFVGKSAADGVKCKVWARQIKKGVFGG